MSIGSVPSLFHFTVRVEVCAFRILRRTSRRDLRTIYWHCISAMDSDILYSDARPMLNSSLRPSGLVTFPFARPGSRKPSVARFGQGTFTSGKRYQKTFQTALKDFYAGQTVRAASVPTTSSLPLTVSKQATSGRQARQKMTPSFTWKLQARERDRMIQFRESVIGVRSHVYT